MKPFSTSGVENATELFQRESPTMVPPKYWRMLGEKPTESPKGLKSRVDVHSGVGERPRTEVPNAPCRPTWAVRAQNGSAAERPAAPSSARMYVSSVKRARRPPPRLSLPRMPR